MNKTAIKNYAIWARVSLIEAAKQRAYQYEITKDNITDAGADVVSGKPLTKEEKEQRKQLIDQINRKGFDQVMEEVAYTWFNRFIALRFMEVNGYLPTKIRVFTDAEGNFKPEILKEALTVELPVDKSRVMELLEKQDNEELYKMLLIAQCNELSNGLPDMFEVISNYTELLFPNNLLKEDSILGEMVNSIPEEDWTDAVQIIGWLYQYYNSELKDETFALLKKNVKISKERIPAATQLFTPDWIVRYMVENSLGRLWYEGHPNDTIKKEWKYYLDEAQQEPEVEEQLKAIREEYKTIKPEDIKVIDPCMGSGHILVYAFDVLMQIYTSAGWSERDAAESILENNLYGLDIDDRAGQLAYFAVMMKARKYNRRILTKNIRPKVYSIQESNNIKIEAWWRLGPEEDIARRLVQNLTDAKEYGSILNLSVNAEELQALRKRLDDIDEMSTEGNLLDVIQSDEITRQLYPLIELAEIMAQKYDVVVTNPPYMGNGNMCTKLSDYLKNYYSNSKLDLCTTFLEKACYYARNNGYISLIILPVWMFLSSYEKLRHYILSNFTIVNMLHFGRGIFGSDFGSVSFVLEKSCIHKFKGHYEKLFGLQGSVDTVEEKEKRFLNKEEVFIQDQNEYFNIPGTPIAYWASNKMINCFSLGKPLGEISRPRIGQNTGDNDRFLRLWHELTFESITFGLTNEQMKTNVYKWLPYNKGGSFRKWYGNQDYVVNWESDGKDIKEYAVIRNHGKHWSRYIQNIENMCNKGITWTFISSSKFGVRYLPIGFICDVNGSAVFPESNLVFSILALLNSNLTFELLRIENSTMSFQACNIAGIPYSDLVKDDCRISELSVECVNESKKDWDSFETSWDYKKNPLV